ncbi:MAG: solute carrier family 23 protein, partial [Anaerolineaceae bacterium]|nr:solute carrier family 23 protein [Anaerolineaceae bacterium]
MATTSKVLGYLPSDTPPFGRMVLLGFQHVLTMFPATVLCALLMHFDVSTVLTITGFGTIVALLGSKFAINTYIPLYYGSSFSYIAAVVSIIGVLEPDLAFGAVASPESISVVTAGFLVTGVINILIGLLIRVTGGKKSLDKILPAEVTGSVAIVIGIGLAYTALTMASGTCCGVEANMAPTLKWWLAALITFLAAVIFSVYLQGKGFIGMLPILLAMILGYIVAIPIGLVDFSTIGASGWITVPKIVFPVFNNALTATALIGVGVMAIATIPESTAHLYQIGLYVDHLAEEQGREKPGLSKHIGLNLMLDGLNDMVNGLFGSTAGTNYGENNSLLVITR